MLAMGDGVWPAQDVSAEFHWNNGIGFRSGGGSA
jgi:hypothetical protein